MTVAELIEALKKCDPNSDCCSFNGEKMKWGPTTVRVIEGYNVYLGTEETDPLFGSGDV